MVFSTNVLATIAAGMLAFPSVANAQCLAVRTYQQSRPLMDDVISMELWDSGVKVCQQRAAKFFADNEDFYQWDCDDLHVPETSWRVQARENGKQIHVQTLSEVGEVVLDYDMTMENFNEETWCSTMTDNGCKLQDTSFEACSWTADLCFPDRHTCSLCDGRVTCDVPP
ncbi:hypothetical protein FZEAL_8792 [Fusarium zealandicum]|uniref:Uncharacterized protein n=1 Tax=Fusarium zealandicum TaxID=1053134 RepID=A0A8H4XHB0_9HYPO|nr:hypothetical protein FZEAL_8792 [Fusarium zealandicum]